MPSTAQPAPETDEKKSRGLGSYVVWVFVAVMVYVLSYGPALRFTFTHPGPHPALVGIYMPVEWVFREPPLRKPFGLYLHIWCPERFDSYGRVRPPREKEDPERKRLE